MLEKIAFINANNLLTRPIWCSAQSSNLRIWIWKSILAKNLSNIIQSMDSSNQRENMKLLHCINKGLIWEHTLEKKELYTNFKKNLRWSNISNESLFFVCCKSTTYKTWICVFYTTHFCWSIFCLFDLWLGLSQSKIKQTKNGKMKSRRQGRCRKVDI